MKSHNKTKSIIGTICRTIIGLTFAFSGFVKALDPLGTTYKIEDYLKAFGGIFNYLLPAAEPMAWCLILFELCLGLCLLFNVRTSVTSWFALAMMLVMTPITLYLALTNPISDCGCFGDAVVLTNWQTFWKNIVLLTLVIVLLVCKKHIHSTFVWQAELCIALIAIVLTASLMIYTRLHLPLIDFRPYKIGNNIPAMMEYPEGAEPDIYETTLIYEKDGVKQTFTLQDYPRGDTATAWTFVDQHTTLVKKGYEPPIHDFEIISLDGDDLTDDVLEADDVVLLIMYDLRKASLPNMSERLHNFAVEQEHNGTELYVLTGSGEQDIDEFIAEYCKESALDYSMFCQTDPVTLKTIVRANPGVVVLHNGTITDKYNLRNR